MKKKLIFILLLIQVAIEAITPVFYQIGILPSEIRWLSHLINLLLIIYLLIRSFRIRPLSNYFLIILAIISLSLVVAISNGQSVTASLWGVWVFARYPLLGLLMSSYSYSRMQDRKLNKFLLSLLILEMSTQIIQYVSGVPVGDRLGGTFGTHGTGMLLFLFLVILAYCFGKWISEKRISYLLLTISFGLISSSLGEMKLFFFAVILMGLLALILYLRKNIVTTKLVYGIIVLALAIIIFPGVMDKFNRKSSSQVIPFWQQITDKAFINRYITFVGTDQNGNYDVGRNYAVKYVWDVISSNSTRFILGDGLGSRGESRALGSAGVQLLSGNLGLFTGSSLVVFLGEMGILSLVYFTIFLIFTLERCIKLIRSDQAPYLVSLGYAVLIFSAFWPIWLWYNTAWTLPGSMPLYWMMWGIVVHYSYYSVKQRVLPQPTLNNGIS